MTTAAPDRFLRLSAVLAQTGLSRTTLYRKVRLGTFPRQIKISERCSGWRESSVCKWLADPSAYDENDEPI
ncbi:MAG: AlpA family phage regulatory protein [Qipengyuania sp.]|nr:AlpA family phage regulatory protein [Qipengyuania sp.]